MSETTKTAGEAKAKNAPTAEVVKRAFDRLSTLLTCGSGYCIHSIPPDIAVGLVMAQEALGWALGHPDSGVAFKKVMALLSRNQPLAEVIFYDINGGPVQEQTDAHMAAKGYRRGADPLAEALAAFVGKPPAPPSSGNPLIDALLGAMKPPAPPSSGNPLIDAILSGRIVPVPLSGTPEEILAALERAGVGRKRGGKTDTAPKTEAGDKTPGEDGGAL